MSQDWQIAYARFQCSIGEWRQAISDKFQFASTSKRTEQWNHRLSQTLRLRANNMEMVVARLMILDKDIPDSDLTEVWTTCLKAVTDTTCVLVDMNCFPATSQIPPAEYNYFIISSMSISLLALLRSSEIYMPGNSPLQPAELRSAQQSIDLCFSLLKTRVGLSRQSRTLWEHAHDLLSRLNLAGLLPAVAPSEASEVIDTLAAPNAHWADEAFTRTWEDQGPISSPKELGITTANYAEGAEGIALAESINPFFNMILDTTNPFNAFEC